MPRLNANQGAVVVVAVVVADCTRRFLGFDPEQSAAYAPVWQHIERMFELVQSDVR